MKIFAIRNADVDKKKDLAFFFYFEKIEEYCMEIVGGADEWEMPFVLDTYVRRGEWTVGMKDTLQFISQRVVPSDRQNIGMILKENGLESYDEIQLFLLSEGRCAQDHCFIRQISYEELPQQIKERRERHLVSVTSIGSCSYLMSFADGTTKLLDIDKYTEQFAFFKRMMAYTEGMRHFRICGAGTEVNFNDIGSLSYDYLYEHGQNLPFRLEDLNAFIQDNMITSQEMTDILGCSRQNINDLVKRGRITPLVTNTKEQIFARTELYKLL